MIFDARVFTKCVNMNPTDLKWLPSDPHMIPKWLPNEMIKNGPPVTLNDPKLIQNASKSISKVVPNEDLRLCAPDPQI